MATTEKIMNHSEYMKKVKKLDIDALRHIIKDCQNAIASFPENPNCGYYTDEIHYASMELKKREDIKNNNRRK